MRAEPFHSYVNGEIVPGGRIVEIINPATEELAGRYTAYTAEIIDGALEAARDAFPAWSAAPLEKRIEWMRRIAPAAEARKDELLDTLMAETGKTRTAAMGDVRPIGRYMEFFAEEVLRLRGETISDRAGTHTHRLVRQPVGVVAAFLAWNFPLFNMVCKLGPILASGCTCVLKPSEKTPLASALFGEILQSMDFPKGVVNIVVGDDRALAERMAASPIPAMLTMIGSVASGRKLMAAGASTIKRYSLELGGNAPVLVYPDADLKTAADQMATLKVSNCGQICVSPNRCFVPRDKMEEFIGLASGRMKEFKLGAGEMEEPVLGPAIDAGHLNGLLDKIDKAKKQGAKFVLGGGRPPKDVCPRGYFIEPAIAVCENRDIDLCREEIFGPILPVIPYDNPGELIDMANETDYGLAAYVYTRDLSRAAACADRLMYGSICVNEPFFGFYLPHGGLRQSGIGKDASHLSLQEYFAIKRVTVRNG